MEEDDFDPLFRYRRRVTDDPIRLHILAAHALIEEMLELVIAEAVPNSECFEVSKMQFWKKLDIVRALERQIHPDRQPKILRPIDKIVVTGPCNFDVSEFKMQHGKLGDITVAWGSGMFLGEKRLLVASKNLPGSQ